MPGEVSRRLAKNDAAEQEELYQVCCIGEPRLGRSRLLKKISTLLRAALAAEEKQGDCSTAP